MSILNINATRMELNRLKQRLLTAKKGHKLLKNKADALLIELLKIIKETLVFKKNLKNNMKSASFNLNMCKIASHKQEIFSIISLNKKEIGVNATCKNILGVNIPSFSIKEDKTSLNKNLNHSFFSNNILLDQTIEEYQKILSNLIKLAEKEKTILILSNEIEKTRKKVNALEHIIIKNLEETIKYISLKLEENERSTKARLTRIK